MSRKKYGGVRFASRWDAGTWMLLILVVVCCIWPIFIDGDWVIPVILTVGTLAMILLVMLGIYYRIDGDQLVIYQFFTPTALPILKIKEIKPTKSLLSSPAAAMFHRIEISFTDRSVLKSSMPLVISPERLPDFIAMLKAVNPDIEVKL